MASASIDSAPPLVEVAVNDIGDKRAEEGPHESARAEHCHSLIVDLNQIREPVASTPRFSKVPLSAFRAYQRPFLFFGISANRIGPSPTPTRERRTLHLLLITIHIDAAPKRDFCCSHDRDESIHESADLLHIAELDRARRLRAVLEQGPVR